MDDGQVATCPMEWSASWRRRAILRLVAGAAGSGLAGLLGMVHAEPGERKRQRRRERQRRRKRRRRRDAAAGPALYPDLQTQPLVGLRFDQLDDGTHVLRFTTTVWNAGEGPLELEAPTSKKRGRAGRLYQNLYDAPVAGERAARRRVHGRIIYHDGHQHYHFADFAAYELLQCDTAGDCRPIGESPKVSFCLVDSELVEGPHPRQYKVCERKRQGITPGYGDIYAADLPDQWVVLSNGPLADGEYALRAIADSENLLAEGGGAREENNAATAYFTVSGGEIANVRATP
jgi:hypothetical protein